ncbi:MAG: hypothetical protein ACK5DD_05190 [Cyclobacteriaceae bacterium]
MSTTVSVKMYRVGELGDCFLVTFRHQQTVRNLLIDCGSFRNGRTSKDRIEEIVTDIKKRIGGAHLDVVVGTHQHNDHVSGFAHSEDLFREIGVNQVWLSWLDNPRNKQAQQIEERHLEHRKSLMTASAKMASLSKTKAGYDSRTPSARKMAATHQLIDEVMGFFGAAPELPTEGMRVLKSLGSQPVQYLSPGECREIPDIPESAIRIHVLGPPKDEELLYRKDPREGDSYDHKLQRLNSMAAQFLRALGNQTSQPDIEEEQFPFNADYKVPISRSSRASFHLRKVNQSYRAKENEWRNIDGDWLEQAARLALYMDTYTNNSSLVLAIEIVDSGKVLLFPGDAQTGNWLSWATVKFKHEDTTLDSLLNRTVLYKVGHHASHNATLKDGFEKMTSDELVAMIPVDKSDPNIAKEKGWKMPAVKLFARLKEKTNSRVLRMEEGFAEGCNPKKSKQAASSWKKVGPVKITPLFIEYTIQ